jgi:hypothetical protein
MEAFDRLKQIIAEAEEDLVKVEKGNKAAGTRLRKKMQDLKAAAQDVRVKVLEIKSEGDAPAPPAPPAPSY